MAGIAPLVTILGLRRGGTALGSAARSNAPIKSRFSSNPIDRMYRQWAFRYAAFVRTRFNRLGRSGGGGQWKPLAASTLKSRRGKTATILRDTGTLFNGLTIGTPQNATKRIRNGVQFGFSGSRTHPEGKLTIRKLAEIHQNGSKRRGIPARPIIVKPDAKTRAGMLRDMRRALVRGGLL